MQRIINNPLFDARKRYYFGTFDPSVHFSRHGDEYSGRVTFVHGIGNKPEPRAPFDLWRRKLAQGAGAIDLGDAGVESSMVYWADVLCERPDPDLSAFESGAGVGVAESPEGHRWDSSPKARYAPDSRLEGSGFELPAQRLTCLLRPKSGPPGGDWMMPSCSWPSFWSGDARWVTSVKLVEIRD